MAMSRGPETVRKRVIKPAGERRAELLDAAMDVFTERGVADATVSDITARAEVAKGSFYLHFSAKEQVVAALWERYVAGYLQLAEAVLADRTPQDDWIDVLTALLERLIDHAVEHADLHRVVYGSADAKALALCWETNQQVIDLLAEAIKRGMTAGVLRQGAPEVFARVTYHGVHGALHDMISDTAPYDKDEVVASMRDIVGRVLDPDR
ncbi:MULTISPECIES: TetR/AcrR family transcriptional regulator [unclassified Nonomuraea]|uniref:TetR/AcrR family transcriptional regulator n=1 Tax=unclassified Nonomuraea TaxID=2593643 RepID=UPI003410B553